MNKKYFIFLIIGLLFPLNSTFAQSELKNNEKVVKDIAGKETQVFNVSAASSEFVRVLVRQQKGDVALSVTFPDQTKYKVDNSNTWTEFERLSFISDSSGIAKIEITRTGSIANDEANDYVIWIEAKRPASETDKKTIEAERLYDKANQLRLQKDEEKQLQSLEIFKQSAKLFSETGDKSGEAYSLYAAAQTLGFLTRLEEAANLYDQSISLFRQTENKSQLAEVIYNSAPVLFRLSRLEETVARLNEAEKIYTEENKKHELGKILNAFAVIYAVQGQTRKAIEMQTKALENARAIGDKNEEGLLLNNIGIGYSNIGEPQKAFEHYEKSREILHQIKDTYLEANALISLSDYYKNIGDPQKSIEYAYESLILTQQIGNKEKTAVNFNNLGNAFDDLGDSERAIEFYEKALALNREAKLRRNEAVNLANLGNMNLKNNDFRAAENFVNQALNIQREVKDKRAMTRSLVKLGEISQKKGDPKKALEYFEQALPLLREIEDRDWEGLTIYLMGDTLRLQGDLQKARQLCLQALVMKQEMLQPLDEAAILNCLALIEFELKNFADAQNYVEKAVAKIETIRTNIPKQDFRRSYFASNQEYYNLLIEILMTRHSLEPKRGFDRTAWQVSEKTRARTFLESLGDADREISANADKTLQTKRAEVLQKINAKEILRIQFLQRKQTAKQLETEKEIKSLLETLNDTEAQIRNLNPKFAEITNPFLANLPEIQSSILDDKTVLINFVPGVKKSFIFLVTKNSLETFEIPKASEINAVAEKFIREIKSKTEEKNAALNNQTVLDGLALQLGKLLFDPIADKIAHKRILIAPTEILQIVPFTALKISGAENKGKYLIESNEIVTIPSVSSLLAMRKFKQAKIKTAETLAIFADPVFSAEDSRLKVLAGQKNSAPAKESVAPADMLAKYRSGFSRLMFSRVEAEVISSLLPADRKFVALDFKASADLVKDLKLEKYKMIHFGTHGIVNSQIPELSGLVLSLVNESGEFQNGFLSLHDIYNLRLNADLVVLSACESALGKDFKGEGSIGLTRGFMYAGAKGTVASLWKIDDRATSDLMKSFYKKIFLEKLKPSEALRQAQIEMLKKRGTENPFYWAAFTFQGDFQ